MGTGGGMRTSSLAGNSAVSQRGGEGNQSVIGCTKIFVRFCSTYMCPCVFLEEEAIGVLVVN